VDALAAISLKKLRHAESEPAKADKSVDWKLAAAVAMKARTIVTTAGWPWRCTWAICMKSAARSASGNDSLTLR